MTQNDCICHTLSSAFRMLGKFGLEGVLLSFNNSHSFCLSLSLLSCVLVFWEVAAVSFSFFFRPTCRSSGTLKIDVRLLISWNLLSCLWLAHWYLLFGLLPGGIYRGSISSECFFSRVQYPRWFVSSVSVFCHPFTRQTRMQSFDFSRSRAVYVTTLSP